MCNSLFFVKAMQFAHLFREIPDVLAKRNKDCGAAPLGDPEDGYTRVVLSLPEVVRVARKELELEQFRLRFAFATEFLEYPHHALEPRLEMYSFEGELLRAIPLHELPQDMSTAIEVELMYVLLLSRGVDISMY